MSAELNDDSESHAKQYLDEDDDERSPLGSAIFEQMFGVSIDDIVDADDEDNSKEQNPKDT